MSNVPDIDSNFLEPLQSAILAFEVRQIPLMIFVSATSRRFVEQVTFALGATAVYISQKDLEMQLRSSLKQDTTLLVVIDQVLAGRTLQLMKAYLAARDIMGADNSQLADLGMPAPSDGHRLALVTEKAVFARHDMATQKHLAEFCAIIGAA